MDAYFRQTWVDRRLRFEGAMPEMAVHIRMLDLIWKPDPHFLNGRGSYLHTTTTPNKLLRIKQDGTVLYSMRLVSHSLRIISHYVFILHYIISNILLSGTYKVKISLNTWT